MVFGEGKYLLVTPENEFEAFFKAVGAAAPPEPLHTYELKTEEDGKFSETLEFGQTFLPGFWFRDYGKFVFESGVEFPHKDLSGSDSNSTITVEENKVSHVQRIGGKVDVKIERVFEENKMITTMTSDVTDIVLKAEFKKIEE